MEWKFHYCVLHFTVTTAEFMMLNVLRRLGSLSSCESLLNIFVALAAVTLSCLTSKVFMLILVNSTAILKTFLETTSSWQFSSEQEIRSLVMIT